jgi:hypothetical protein
MCVQYSTYNFLVLWHLFWHFWQKFLVGKGDRKFILFRANQCRTRPIGKLRSGSGKYCQDPATPGVNVVGV